MKKLLNRKSSKKAQPIESNKSISELSQDDFRLASISGAGQNNHQRNTEHNHERCCDGNKGAL